MQCPFYFCNHLDGEERAGYLTFIVFLKAAIAQGSIYCASNVIKLCNIHFQCKVTIDGDKVLQITLNLFWCGLA